MGYDNRVMMYHVCESWDGGDLESIMRRHGESAEDAYAARWPEAGELGQHHANYVHLHRTISEALDFAAVFCSGKPDVLAIDTTELNVEIDALEYEHPMVRDVISLEFISRTDGLR